MLSRVLLVFFAAFFAFAATPPTLRLDDSVRPVRYSADLTLLTDANDFSGIIEIEIELRQPTSLIWLNAVDLRIRQATVRAGNQEQAASVEAGNTNFTGLRVPKELPAGTALLHIAYEGRISRRNSAGIFQGRDGNNTYLFTQFEAIDARRAFPCFDQPGFKTPWQLTLHIKRENQAISNTAVMSETEESGGMKRLVFAPTKPLPSYLVAFAVGPFDIVDAGRAGRNRIPVRMVAPKGKGVQAKYAAEVTGPIIDQLENYFGMPFPFDKADMVAIPVTFGFTAMENAAMVTCAEGTMLADPATDTTERQRRYASVAAHELAHQWFGDLVTLAWWDDTWLNEAFATWTSSKIMATWKPEWNTRFNDLGNKFGAMRQDSLASARRIRQPIDRADDIFNSFDSITYQKGAAVIRMFENWVGEKQFQSGVETYLKRYSSRNATEGDFLDAISAAGQPRLERAFASFLEQPGFPEISVDLKCDGAPRITLSQKRYHRLGSTLPEETWQIPVCVRYPSASGPQRECFLLDRASAEFRLTKTNACPAYLSANDGATGYYDTSYRGDLAAKVLEHSDDFLDPGERRTLLHDMRAAATAGEVPLRNVLEAVFRFAREPQRQIVEEARDAADLQEMRPLSPTLLPNYHRYIRKAFGDRAATLGWAAKPGEEPEAALLRANLVPFVAIEGDDRTLQNEARRRAEQWLADRKGVDPNMIGSVLRTAAAVGDRQLFDKMVTELRNTADRQQRGYLFRALGSFRDPKLVKASLDLLLDPSLDLRETLNPLLLTTRDEADTERLPFEFLKANYDKFLGRLPSGGPSAGGASLANVGAGFCDANARADFVGFFEKRSQQFTGGPRIYTQVLERIRLCEAQQAAQGASLTAFLQTQ